MKFGLTLLEELDLLRSDIKNYNLLFPYEKEYLLRRVGELVKQHKNLVGEPLTSQVLDSIQIMTNSR